MYPVTNAFLNAMRRSSQKTRLGGKLKSAAGADIATLSDNDFLKNTVTIKNKCSDSTDVKLGGVFVGEFKATLINTHNQARGSWRGKRIAPTFGLLTGVNTWEDIPCGEFTIDSATWTENGVEITAYDAMAKFEKDLPATQTTGKFYDIVTAICEACGVPFGMTRIETEALPNGNILLSLFSENDCKTYRDVLYWLAQTVAGFATIDRTGALVFRSYQQPEVYEVTSDDRLRGSKFSDFKTKYTGLSVVDMQNKTTVYIHAEIDDGATMNLGSNPFIQYGVESTKDAMRRAILEAIQTIQFTPFKSSMLGNPAFDLGDVLLFTDGIAEEEPCCLMSYEWRLKQTYSLEGYGANPALTSAQSKTDKDINGLSKSSSSNEIRFFSYVNAAGYEVGTAQQQVSSVRFSNDKETEIETWTEIQLETELNSASEAMQVQAFYYLDGDLLAYSPIETYRDSALHILGLHWFQLISDTMPHTWVVKLKATGGTVTINPAGVHTVIKGQGLAKQAGWDGTISASDNIGSVIIAGFTVPEFTDVLNINLQIPETLTGADTVSAVPFELVTTPAITDEIDINIKYVDSVLFAGETEANPEEYLAGYLL